MENTHPTDSLLNVSDVARRLSMSAAWVYKASERGEIPHLRIGGALRFEPAAIAAWVASRRRGQ